MVKPIIYIIIVLSFSLLKSQAQFYNTGQAPSQTDWKQIKKDNYRIIYPEGTYASANYIANMLDVLDTIYVGSPFNKGKRFPFILHSSSVLSNGYVTWTPRRSELVMTPATYIDNQSWREHLLLHEYRHILQLKSLHSGFTKYSKIALGEIAIGATSAYIPPWHYEGDAVWFETRFSKNGRGRMGRFSQGLFALSADTAKQFNYDKAILGSYKDYLPNHYVYGYHMSSTVNSMARNNTHPLPIYKHVGNFSFAGIPFYLSLKNHTGFSKVRLYNFTTDSLKNYVDNRSHDHEAFEPIFDVSNPFYSNYLHPFKINGTVYSVKTGIDIIPQLIAFDSVGSEAKVTEIGYGSNTHITANERYVVWNEIYPSIRWQQENYSDIVIYSISDSKKRRITNKERLFYPSISKYNDSIVALRINKKLNNYLEIIDLNNDSHRITIDMPDSIEISYMTWLDSNRIVFCGTHSNTSSIFIYDLKNRNLNAVYSSNITGFTNLAASNNRLFFTSDNGVKTDIYSLELKDTNLTKLTNSRFGADFPFPSGQNQLLFSEYTSNGYTLVKKRYIKAELNQQFIPEKKSSIWNESVDMYPNLTLPDDTVEYREQDYHEFLHLFNFHSWVPFYYDYTQAYSSTNSFNPGIMLFSQNDLSTVTSSISYYYNDQRHNIRPRILIEKWFPTFDISLHYASPVYRAGVDTLLSGRKVSLNIKPSVPLNFSNSLYNKIIRFSINYEYLAKNEVHDQRSNGTPQLVAYILKRKSLREIYPNLGQVFTAAYKQPLYRPKVSQRLLLRSITYMPGFMSTHSSRLTLEYEHQPLKKFINRNSYWPLSGKLNDNFHTQILNSKVSYTFPFLYPEINLGPIIYIKRLFTTCSYHLSLLDAPKIANNKSYYTNRQLHYFQIEAYMDYHLFRFFYPLRSGISLTYVPSSKKHFIGINLFNFSF